MFARRLRQALCGAAMLGLLVSPAAAQNPVKTDIAVGYQFTHLFAPEGGEASTLPAGWTASVSRALKSPLNLIAEVNGAYRDGASLHNVLGGIRFGGGPTNGTNFVVISGQLLAGLGHSSSANALVIQPGAVIDVRKSGPLGARFNVDYTIARADGTTDTGLRVAAGLVVNLGRSIAGTR